MPGSQSYTCTRIYKVAHAHWIGAVEIQLEVYTVTEDTII